MNVPTSIQTAGPRRASKSASICAWFQNHRIITALLRAAVAPGAIEGILLVDCLNSRVTPPTLWNPSSSFVSNRTHTRPDVLTRLSWATVDGKSAIKAIGPTASHFALPDGVSIDWLTLDADKTSRTGIFSDIGIVQRLYTGAGAAPTAGCSANQVYESGYTAHYYFWISK